MAIGFALLALDLLYDGRYSVTRQDYWRIYRLDLRFPFPLNALYKHNDHPVFFPSLFWLPILHFFHNDQTLLFLCGCALTLGTLLLFLVALWRSPSLGLVARLALALLATIATLWLGKANITASGGFSCMNSLTTTAVVAGLLILHRWGRVTSGYGWICFGLATAGTVATFSFGTGLAAWPTFLLLALLLRTGWRLPAGLGVAGVLSAIVLLCLPNNARTEIGRGLSHLWTEAPALLLRFFQVLGAPWIRYGEYLAWRPEIDGVDLAGAIGALGCLLALYFSIKRFKSLRESEPVETVALGLMIFTAGSIALIVIGRGELLATYPRDVLAPRYCFWSPFFWLALPVLALYCWPRLRNHQTLLASLALVLTAGSLPSQWEIGAVYAQGRRDAEDAALRLICGADDAASLQNLFRSEHYAVSAIRPLARTYRQRGLDMFAWPGAKLVGQKLTFPLAGPAGGPGLLGHWRLDQVLKSERNGNPPARFSGWCLTRKTHRTADYVLICQPNGAVVGLGRFTVDQPARNQKYRLPTRDVLGFQGYIRSYSEKQTYLCFASIEGRLDAQPLRRIGLDSDTP